MKFILFCILLVIQSFSFAESNLKPAKKCLKLGESDYRGGVPTQKDIESLTPCCEGLVQAQAINQIVFDGNGGCMQASGGYGYTCIACGDGKCDKKYENECNCPSDCKKKK